MAAAMRCCAVACADSATTTDLPKGSVGEIMRKTLASSLLYVLLVDTLAFSPYRKHSVASSMLSSSSIMTTSSNMRPWYSDSAIERDRSHLSTENLYLETTRLVLITKNGVCHRETNSGSIEPLYYRPGQVDSFLEPHGGTTLRQILARDDRNTDLVAWIGKHNHHDYWVLFCDELSFNIQEDVVVSPLREFGDRLESTIDAGILATANGLVNFHTSHRYCSMCGAATEAIRFGACRKCSSCNKSIYPRQDVASIMLITTQCGEYALLGRKKSWPAGRYSCLAGFLEVGETIEECCIRETYEESGIEVEPASVRFVASQPWPFPRSLMVGFQAKAKELGLPKIEVDLLEMEDIQWFPKDYVRKRLGGGSTALGFTPSETEAEFHIPGRSSLARVLIARWAQSDIINKKNDE